MHRPSGGYTRLNFGSNFGGYTVFEVMLVLAISSIILVSAVTAFSGKQTSTEFTQSVQDLASKIQSYASDVTSGASPDISGQRCRNVNGHPHFDNSPNPSPNECIYMGRALLVAADTDSISAYAVFGVRDYTPDPSKDLFLQSSPTIADPFFDTYDLGNLKIVSSSVTLNGATTSSIGLVGLYSDLAGAGSSDTANSTSLLTKGYSFTGTSSGDIQSCIEATTCSSTVDNFNNWTLCVQYAGGRKAQIITSATASSLNAQVKVADCT